MNDKRKEVDTLIEKAAAASNATDAVLFSEAAHNVAKALATLIPLKNSQTT